MRKNKIRYYFDREADVLYFTQKKPSSRDISREVDEGILSELSQRQKR